MTTQHTFQQLERNSTAGTRCGHPADSFCINCLIHVLLDHRDFRYDVAAIAMLDLRRLATLRARANGGSSWRDSWDDVLDPDRLDADLSSEDSARRVAAESAQQSFGDFLACRDAKRITIADAKWLNQIMRRVRKRAAEIEREGIEPDIGYIDFN